MRHLSEKRSGGKLLAANLYYAHKMLPGFPGSPGVATQAACCTSSQFCCSGPTPMGGSWAYVNCCESYQFCYRDPFIVKCEPCPTTLCGGMCCQTGQTCVNGRCCPVDRVCGNVCCPTGQMCVNGSCQPCPADRVCGGVCCPPGQTCVNGTCQACPADRVCGNICCPPGRSCVSVPSPRGGQRFVCLCPRDRVCGANCCQRWETCVNGTCCPRGRRCGDLCCPPDSTCSSLPSRTGTRHICLRRPRRFRRRLVPR